jgi:hypothetical protein
LAIPGFYFLDQGQTPTAPAPEIPSSHSLALGEGVPGLTTDARPFDPHAVRRDFPILSEEVHGKQLVWLDNGATTQKPQSVIDRLSYFYEHENSNIHRAAHELAARSEDAYEGARDKVRLCLDQLDDLSTYRLPQCAFFLRHLLERLRRSAGHRKPGDDPVQHSGASCADNCARAHPRPSAGCQAWADRMHRQYTRQGLAPFFRQETT